MASHEPTLWGYMIAIPFIIVVGVIQLFLVLAGVALFCLVASIGVTGCLRLVGHIVYSVTAICFGPESRLCGLILECEQEELAYRQKRRRKALERMQKGGPSLSMAGLANHDVDTLLERVMQDADDMDTASVAVVVQ